MEPSRYYGVASPRQQLTSSYIRKNSTNANNTISLLIACTYAASPSSNTVTRLGCMDEVPNAPSGPATWYMPDAGVDANSGSFITSETSGVKLRHRKAMTVKNLAAYFFNSGDPDTVTVHSRKNGANGNLTCSIVSLTH